MKLLSLNIVALALVVLGVTGMIIPTAAVTGGEAGTDQVWDKPAIELKPADGPNGDYASIDSNGNLSVDLSEIHPNAITTVENVFTIRNTENTSYRVWVSHDGGEAVDFSLSNGQSLENSDNPVKLEPDQVHTVGLVIDTRGIGSTETLMTTMTLHAERVNESESAPSTPPTPTESPTSTATATPDAETQTTPTPSPENETTPTIPTPEDDEESVEVDNDGPTVQIEVPANVSAGEEVTLHANVTNEVGDYTVTWVFSDGTTAEGENVTRSFEQGETVVEVIVEDESGAIGRDEVTVVIGEGDGGENPSLEIIQFNMGLESRIAVVGLLALFLIALLRWLAASRYRVIR